MGNHYFKIAATSSKSVQITPSMSPNTTPTMFSTQYPDNDDLASKVFDNNNNNNNNNSTDADKYGDHDNADNEDDNADNKMINTNEIV